MPNLSRCIFVFVAVFLFRFHAGLARLEKPYFDHVMRSIELRPQYAATVLMTIALACVLVAVRLSFWYGLKQAVCNGRRGRNQGGFISALTAGVSAGLWGAAQGRRGYKITWYRSIKTCFGPPGSQRDAFEETLIRILPDYTHLAELIHDDPPKYRKP